MVQIPIINTKTIITTILYIFKIIFKDYYPYYKHSNNWQSFRSDSYGYPHQKFPLINIYREGLEFEKQQLV